jgi:hypothetical protein
MIKNDIIIIGSGGHSRVILDSFIKDNYNYLIKNKNFKSLATLK